MTTNERDTISASFSYEVFDRQLKHFLMMIQVLMEGWDDYSSQELSCELNSLCIKVSRLCYMADQDLALQHADVPRLRKEKNEYWHLVMEDFVKKRFSPFVFPIINGFKEGKLPTGHDSPMFSSKLSVIFPRLFDLLTMEGMKMERQQELQGLILTMETMLGEESPLLLSQISDISATSHEVASYVDSSESSGEMVSAQAIDVLLRFSDILRLYALTSYLQLHFRRVCHVTSRPLEAEEAVRFTEMKVQQYINQEEGKRSLDLYLVRLQYDNDNKPLNMDQWLKARRELKAQVPPKFELAFLYYADDPNKAGEELTKLTFTAEEYEALVDVLAKYQFITRRIFEICHPEEQAHTLPNEAFNWVVNGKSLNLQELKKSIGKMVDLVTRKNHWFCVWSVLKHLCLIREECTFATFAHQMMSPEWFGDIDPRLRFSADNLSDYSRYFNEYDFTDWTEAMFLEKKELYGMTKWSPKLYATFSSLCDKMMKAIWGYRFLEKG